MSKYILFAGRKQVGKGTSAYLCKLLLSHYTLAQRVEIQSFATALKRGTSEFFGIPYKELIGTDEEKNKPTYIKWNQLQLKFVEKYGKKLTDYVTRRELLQLMGTDVMREGFYPEIWVDRVFKGENNNDIIIIDDGRFENEIRACLDVGGISILIKRHTGFVDNHPSEQVEKLEHMFKHVIVNDGTLDELENKLRIILIQEHFIEMV